MDVEEGQLCLDLAIWSHLTDALPCMAVGAPLLASWLLWHGVLLLFFFQWGFADSLMTVTRNNMQPCCVYVRACVVGFRGKIQM